MGCSHSEYDKRVTVSGRTYCRSCATTQQRSWRTGIKPDIVDIYTDTGCELAPKCLECPLPVCKEDDPMWYVKRIQQRRYDRNVIILDRLKTVGKSETNMLALAAEFKLTTRTLWRIWSKNND